MHDRHAWNGKQEYKFDETKLDSPFPMCPIFQAYVERVFQCRWYFTITQSPTPFLPTISLSRSNSVIHPQLLLGRKVLDMRKHSES